MKRDMFPKRLEQINKMQECLLKIHSTWLSGIKGIPSACGNHSYRCALIYVKAGHNEASFHPVLPAFLFP